MRLELLFLGKTKASYLAEAIEDYSERLRHYAPVDIRVIKEIKHGRRDSPAKIREADSQLLMAGVTLPSFVIALDGGGPQVTTEGFLELLNRWEAQGQQRLSFLIGGPLGLDALVLARANHVLALSRMTFTHDMARLIVLEQLYRVFTIRAGQKYHK